MCIWIVGQHFIGGLWICPSIVGSSPPLGPSTDLCLLPFWSMLPPCHCWMSSCHLLLGLPLDLFLCLTCHSVHLTVHLLSLMHATCTAHFHLVFVMTFRISSTLVLSLIVEFRICPAFFSLFFSELLPFYWLCLLWVTMFDSRRSLFSF